MTNLYYTLEDAQTPLAMNKSQILQSCLKGEIELLLYIPNTCKVEIQYPKGVQEQLSAISTLTFYMSKINDGDYTFLALTDTHAKILDCEGGFSILDDRCISFGIAYKRNPSLDVGFGQVSSVSDVFKAMSLNYLNTDTQVDCSNGFLYTDDLNNTIVQIGGDKPTFNLLPKSTDSASEALAITSRNIFIFTHELNRFKVNANKPKTTSKIALKRQEFLLTHLNSIYSDIMCLPNGTKACARTHCLERPDLFTPNTFDAAWKDASKYSLISLHNRAKYTKRG